MKPGLDLSSIVVLTGAGISAESGISTFRDAGGLWEGHRIEEVATVEAFERDPMLVWKFYSRRRINAARAAPNLAHEALVEFAAENPGVMSLITQNVDGLHQRADGREVLAPVCMHGSLHQSRCTHCGSTYFDDFSYFDDEGNYAPGQTNLCDLSQRSSPEYLHHYKLEYAKFLPLSPCCRRPLRPHIVWFGETPLHLPRIDTLLKKAKIFLSIGTSGVVYPAAGFIQVAKAMGARTVCINKEEIPQAADIDEFIQGSATLKVREFLSSLGSRNG